MSETTADRIALLRKAKTLPDLIANRAKTAPDDEALRQYDRSKGEWVSTTFGELQERILEWHKAYAALKLERGSGVGILLPNRDRRCLRGPGRSRERAGAGSDARDRYRRRLSFHPD